MKKLFLALMASLALLCGPARATEIDAVSYIKFFTANTDIATWTPPGTGEGFYATTLDPTGPRTYRYVFADITTPDGYNVIQATGDENGRWFLLYTVSVPNAATVTRSLNTAFQVSATRGADVVYSVRSTVTASITGGQNGDVILETADNSGFTTNVQTLAISGQGQTYTLAVALQGVQPQTGTVSGYVEPGKWVRIRTVNNTGTPGYTYRNGRETLR